MAVWGCNYNFSLVSKRTSPIEKSLGIKNLGFFMVGKSVITFLG